MYIAYDKNKNEVGRNKDLEKAKAKVKGTDGYVNNDSGQTVLVKNNGTWVEPADPKKLQAMGIYGG